MSCRSDTEADRNEQRRCLANDTHTTRTFRATRIFRRAFDVDAEAAWLRVEEFVDDKTLVIRAEIPDIDPDKDVELSVSDDTLHIRAERQLRSERKDKDSYRSEFRLRIVCSPYPAARGATPTM